MDALGNFIKILSVPLGILNALSGIVSIAWLLVIWDWKVLLLGIAILFISNFVIGLLMLPSAAILLATAAAGGKTNFRGITFFSLAFLGNLYVVAVISIWCIAVLVLFGMAAQQGHHSIIPYLLGSYAIALSPWQMMAARESGIDAGSVGSVIIIFFAQIAYAVIMLMILAASPTIEDVAIIFGGIMFIAWVIQSRIAIQLAQESL